MSLTRRTADLEVEMRNDFAMGGVHVVPLQGAAPHTDALDLAAAHALDAGELQGEERVEVIRRRGLRQAGDAHAEAGATGVQSASQDARAFTRHPCAHVAGGVYAASH